MDEVSRLLGQIESDIKSLRRDSHVLSDKLAQLSEKIDSRTVADASFTGIIETVNRHEAMVQKGAGILVVLTALSTTLALFAKDIFGWVIKKFGS